MPPMLATPPAAPKAPPQAPPSGPSGKNEQGDFSPHLKNAISGRKDQHQSGPDSSRKDAAAATDKTTHTDSPSQTAKTSPAADASDSTDSTDSTGSVTAEGVTDGQNEEAEPNNPATLLAETPQPITIRDISAKFQLAGFSAEAVKAAPMAPMASMASASATEPAGTLPPVATLLTEPSQALSPQAMSPQSLATQFSSILPEHYPAKPDLAARNSLQPAAGGKQEALINQLQQIIDNGKETGTVSITRAGSALGLPETTLPEKALAAGVGPATATVNAGLTGLLVADGNDLAPTDAKPAFQVTGNRHEGQLQYFQAKMGASTSGDSNTNFQHNQQGDELAKQAMAPSPHHGLLSGSEPSGAFSHLSALTPLTAIQQGPETTQPVLLPSGTMVREGEIFQQLTERLQLSGRNMDTRINLRLHPAELGALRIDLTVKDGAIRANVVAQSHHTQEILEKNLPKLKAILESQGYTVEHLMVTSESDSVGDFDQFDRQLFGGNDYTPIAPRVPRGTETAFTLDAGEYAAPTASTGVNVKI